LGVTTSTLPPLGLLGLLGLLGECSVCSGTARVRRTGRTPGDGGHAVAYDGHPMTTLSTPTDNFLEIP
jgi:hypothetical protein